MSEMEVSEGRLLSQDFGAGGPPTAVEVPPLPRTVETVTLEIRTLQHQANGIILSYAIEIGRRLEEAKAMLPHGEWGAWLKRELDYSPSTAQNFMKVFREYGDSQQSLFGGVAKSQMFGNLSYSKALRLLAIPDEEERERFVEEHDVAAMSVRELNEALKARDEAEEKAVAAEDEARKLRQEAERLQEQLTGQAQVYEAKLTSAWVEADQAKAADEKRRAAEEALEAAQKELAELKDKGPEVRELTQEEKDALTADAVERIKAENAERMQALEKQLAKADPDTTTLMVLFKGWQETYTKMWETLHRIDASDGDKGQKLRGGIRKALETALEQI